MNDEQPAVREGSDVDAPAQQVSLVVRDDLGRSRLTVFFRIFLAIPHVIVLLLWGLLAQLIALVNWFVLLFTGRPVAGLHNLQCSYLRYLTHVNSYVFLAANPFPGFAGEAGSYPIDLEVPEPHRQNRWITGFRLILVIPALLLGASLGLGLAQAGGYRSASFAVAFLAWFVCLARARIPQGMRDLLAYTIGYAAQVYAYLLLATDRYPNSDPRVVDYPEPAPDHPIRVSSDDDLRRSRLTVFFRLFLAIPHIIWLGLWGLVVWLAALINWFVTLFAGRPVDAFHRFFSAYLRYQTHVTAYVTLVANPFPGFTGRPGSYPIDVHIGPRERQNRWKTFFRIFLAIPAFLIQGAIPLGIVAIYGWFVGVILGRMPQGLRNLGIFSLRYRAQVNGYVLLLLTDRYPFSGPSFELATEQSAPVPEPGPAPS